MSDVKNGRDPRESYHISKEGKTSSAKRDVRLIGEILSLGILLGVCLAIGIAGGIWIDNRWHSHPLGVISGIGFGFAAGIVQAVRVLKESLRYRVVQNHKTREQSSHPSDETP